MSAIKEIVVKDAYLNLSGGLLEAPFWESPRNSLRFVDIVKKKLYFVDLTKGPSSLQTHDLEHSVGVTADVEGNDDEFIVGGKRGYGLFNRNTGKQRLIKEMWTDAERQDDGGGKPKAGKNKEERMRSNDGAVDGKGRFLVGTMNDPALVGEGFTDEGIVFRLDSDLSIHRVFQPVTIPNGISWSDDNKTIYFTDSPSGKIVAYPYDLETGAISTDSGKPFFTNPYEGCVPDGHCRDIDGNFWICFYGSSKVLQVNPEGEVLTRVHFPTRNVTCPTICGTELFVTSAEEHEGDKYPDSSKFQGSLFRVDIGVKGRPLNKFRLATTPA